MGPGPVPEGGRVWDTGGKKKTAKVLERWPLASNASPGDFEKRRSVKRLQRTQTGKGSKEKKTQDEGRKLGIMEKWLRQDKDSVRTLQSPKRKVSAVDVLEPSGQEERKSGDKSQLGT